MEIIQWTVALPVFPSWRFSSWETPDGVAALKKIMIIITNDHDDNDDNDRSWTLCQTVTEVATKTGVSLLPS